MRYALVLWALSACTSGEPMNGTVAIHVADDTTEPENGAAIVDWTDNTHAMLLMSNDGIDCQTNESSIIRGTLLTFSITPTTGEQHPLVQVGYAEGTGYHLTGTTGDVTIDSLDGRITGTIAFETTDNKGTAVSANGTFDVKRCF